MFFDELTVQNIGAPPKSKVAKRIRKQKDQEGVMRKRRRKRQQLLKELRRGGEGRERRRGQRWPWPFMAWPWLCPCLFYPLASIVETVYDN